MFACQNFLKHNCSKFYKEQKLLHGHLMQMSTTCLKSAYKVDLGAVLTLSKNFAKSWRHQFAWSILGASYLFIHVELVFVPVDKLVELD